MLRNKRHSGFGILELCLSLLIVASISVSLVSVFRYISFLTEIDKLNQSLINLEQLHGDLLKGSMAKTIALSCHDGALWHADSRLSPISLEFLDCQVIPVKLSSSNQTSENNKHIKELYLIDLTFKIRQSSILQNKPINFWQIVAL